MFLVGLISQITGRYIPFHSECVHQTAVIAISAYACLFDVATCDGKPAVIFITAAAKPQGWEEEA